MHYKINWIFSTDVAPAQCKEPVITLKEKETIIAQVEQAMWDCGKLDPSIISGNIVVSRNGNGFAIIFRSTKPDDILEVYFKDLFDGFMLN